MRVNNINSTLNFRRVIPIEYKKLECAKDTSGFDRGLGDIEYILKAYKPYCHTRKESDKIRKFFWQKIEDYNTKSVSIVEFKDGAALLTGKDARHIENVKKSGKSDEEISEIIAKRIENGEDGRLKSVIILESAARNKADKNGKTLSIRDASRFDSIKYQCTYSSKRPEKFIARDGKTYTSYQTEIFDEGELKI